MQKCQPEESRYRPEGAFDRIERERAHAARSGDEVALLDLLRRFEPLCHKCARHFAGALPHHDGALLLAEVHFEFLVLVGEFDAERGVSFAGYIAEMLPRRMHDWVKKEWLHSHREIAFEVHPDEDGEAQEINFDSHESQGESTTEHDIDCQVWWAQALVELPLRQRQIMEWTRQGLTERAIAAKLGISGPAVHKTKSLAQKTLQKKYRETL